MKKQLSIALSLVLTVVLVLSTVTTSAFAKTNGTQIEEMAKWLSDVENTDFDFSDTSYLDTNILWTVFALQRADAENYSEFGDYINTVVENNYDGLYPSNFALIYLACDAYGLDTTSIGSHDIEEALRTADYQSQTYLSSLYYPLIAMNYMPLSDCDEVKQTIVSALLAAQQTDGGFPYSTVDSGWGIYSDVDTTSFVLQALAPYSDEEPVKIAIDNALAYIETQKFDDGCYGYTAYNSKSAESTSQAIIALCALDTDAQDSADALVNNFINSETGAAQNYAGVDDTMSSYQTLLALVEYDNYVNDNGSIYKYSADEETKTESVCVYRLYNPNSGEHFYTLNTYERDNLVSLGWTDEGIGWMAPSSSTTPVYRLYNENSGEHHYTINVYEKDSLVALGWTYEGTGWYSDDNMTVPIYRQYNQNAFANNHNFTANKYENDWLVSLGWQAEGVGWYGVA